MTKARFSHGAARPLLLDLFCKAGGCTKGYQRAGFYVVGVDIEPQPNYCGDEFVQADAVAVLRALLDGETRAGFFLREYDAIHASPPCQAHSTLKARWRDREHPDIIPPTRVLLQQTGLPYVIENVEGARKELIDPLTLCGSSFGLGVRRHRLFETNFPWMAPPCAHGQQRAQFDIYEHGKWRKSPVAAVYGHGGGKDKGRWSEAMGIDWMIGEELAQAIPPAYTEHIGHYLMAEVNRRAEAVAA